MSFCIVFGDIEIIDALNEVSPLVQWFKKVIDMPFDEFEIEDPCRSIR